MFEPTLISLFAGAGGLDIGLEEAGFKTILVNELGAHACETLRQNKIFSTISESEFEPWFQGQLQSQRCHKNISASEIARMRERLYSGVGTHSTLRDAHVLERDVRLLSSNEIFSITGKQRGEVFMVAGGPPCQPFSRAGKRETVETTDGRLFLEFVRIVQDVQPRWFLFENVKGLAQSRTVVPRVECSDCHSSEIVPFSLREDALSESYSPRSCGKCGGDNVSVIPHDVRGGSLDIILSEFSRIGYKCHFKILNAADFGVPQSRERLFIVGSRDGEAFTWPTATHRDTSKRVEKANGQSRLFADEEQLLPWQTVKDVLWREGHPDFGKLDPKTAVIWVKNVVRPHAEPVTWTLDRPSPTVGAHQAAKLAVAPFGVPEEQLARQQWHTTGHRQRDLPPVHVDHAMLSDAELLTLQTFPHYWYLYGTRMERAFQIGNAVPPRLASVVGTAILQASQSNTKCDLTGGIHKVPEEIFSALCSSSAGDFIVQV